MITVGAFGGILLLMQLLNDYFQFYEDISAGLERRYFSSFSRMLTHIVLGYACIMYVNGISSKTHKYIVYFAILFFSSWILFAVIMATFFPIFPIIQTP